MLAPMLAFGIPLALAAATVLYFKHVLEGPSAPIVVVDRRTMRRARHRIAAAIADDELVRAHAGLVGLLTWLDDEIHFVSTRRRVEYAAVREHAELQQEHVMRQLGLLDPTI